MRDGRLEVADLRAFDSRPDGFNAARFVMAAIDDDAAEVDRILLENPIVPLMAGMLAVAIALGEQAANDDTDKLRKVLDLLALSPTLDGAGTADAYRKRVTG